MMTRWRKSSYSGGANDATCVELAGLLDAVGVRDSKDPDGGRLALSAPAFEVLVRQIKQGVLDLR
ncbi:DUF397 domain-containing protein [Spirillospora sp. NPDC029432]|uniref:DUF397 domain-containing protein n=1 Tax=Spirillospora sp. NPDC029432 TaxID=3154599 RepID=UPI003454628D